MPNSAPVERNADTVSTNLKWNCLKWELEEIICTFIVGLPLNLSTIITFEINISSIMACTTKPSTRLHNKNLHQSYWPGSCGMIGHPPVATSTCFAEHFSLPTSMQPSSRNWALPLRISTLLCKGNKKLLVSTADLRIYRKYLVIISSRMLAAGSQNVVQIGHLIESPDQLINRTRIILCARLQLGGRRESFLVIRC